MKSDLNHYELEYIKCNSCKSDDYKILFRGRDYRFGRKEEYTVVRCSNCGLIYLNPRPGAGLISKLYEENYTSENNPKITPRVEDVICKGILKRIWHKINGQYIDEIIDVCQGRILDIGCGNGYLLLLLKRKGCETYGIETNSKSVNVCNQLGLEVFCGTLEEAKFPDNFFDVIILSQVLEHLPSPKGLLGGIFRILKPNGKVLIYCPNANSYLAKVFGKYWHGWHIPFHFYAFTEKTIRNFIHKVGFRVENVSTITPDNFFIVSLKDYFFGEKNSNIRPIDRGKFFDSLFFRTVISPVFRLLDLLTQNGDCLKVELKK